MDIEYNKQQISEMESEEYESGLRPNDDADCGVAAFVMKLYDILKNPKNALAIGWHPDGKSFVINSISELSSSVLPHYFRHHNYQSFIRQLNMYNFMKLKTTKGHRFRHPSFLKHHEAMLKMVKRRPEKKKKRESQELLQGEKENQHLLKQESTSALTTQTTSISNTAPAVFVRRKTKKVSFAVGTAEGEDDSQNNWSMMGPSAKWVPPKEEDGCWSRIRSYKSIDCSLKMIDGGSNSGSERIIMGEDGKPEEVGVSFLPKDNIIEPF